MACGVRGGVPCMCPFWSGVDPNGMQPEIIGLDGWWATPPGQHLLAWEQAHFDEAVVDLFGFNALQLGVPDLDALRANRMPHRWLSLTHTEVLGLPDRAGSPLAMVHQLVADPAALPFPDGSLDLIVLPHTLEFSADPHAALREVWRVLRPEGRVVLSGFNPFSFWGGRQFGAHLCSRLGVGRGGLARLYLPRAGDFIGPGRLRDWLRLLGLDVEATRFGIYQPAARSERWLQRFAWLDALGRHWWPIFGAVYFMVAVKRVQGVRLLGPAWKPYRSVAPARPASATGCHTQSVFPSTTQKENEF